MRLVLGLLLAAEQLLEVLVEVFVLVFQRIGLGLAGRFGLVRHRARGGRLAGRRRLIGRLAELLEKLVKVLVLRLDIAGLGGGVGGLGVVQFLEQLVEGVVLRFVLAECDWRPGQQNDAER